MESRSLHAEQESTTVRGPSLWIAGDEFGVAVLDRLHDSAISSLEKSEILESTRFITVGQDHPITSTDATSLATLSGDIRQRVGALLSRSPGRQKNDPGRFVEPSIWFVADAASPEFTSLWNALSTSLAQLRSDRIFARLFVLVRVITWQDDHTGSGAHDSSRTLFTLAEAITNPESPQVGRTEVFVVSDFDAENRRYTATQCLEVAQYFAEFAFLSDITHLQDHPGFRIFEANPHILSRENDSPSAQVFSGVGAHVLLIPLDKAFRQTIEERNLPLAHAVLEPPPSGWRPIHAPTLQRADTPEQGVWSHLALPTWRLPFLRDSIDAWNSAAFLWEKWLADAEEWRHDQLVTAFEFRHTILKASDDAVDVYDRALKSRCNSLLATRSLPGFVIPMQRLLARCRAEVEVGRADLELEPGINPPGLSERELVRSVPHPVDKLSSSTSELMDSFRDRTNPLTLLLSALFTILATWYWLYFTIRFIRDSGIGSLFRFLERQRFANLSSFASRWIERIDSIHGPDTTKFIVWAFGAILLYVVFVTMSVLHRDRRRIELELNRMHHDAQNWRDGAQKTLSRALESIADWHYTENSRYVISQIDIMESRLIDLTSEANQIIQDHQSSQPDIDDIGLDAERSLFRTVISPCLEEHEFGAPEAEACLIDFRTSEQAQNWNDIPAQQFIEDLSAFASRWIGDSPPTLSMQPVQLLDQIAQELRLPAAQPLVRASSIGANYQTWAIDRFIGAPNDTPSTVQRRLPMSHFITLPNREVFFDISIQSNLRASDLCSPLLQTPLPEFGQESPENQEPTDPEPEPAPDLFSFNPAEDIMDPDSPEIDQGLSFSEDSSDESIIAIPPDEAQEVSSSLPSDDADDDDATSPLVVAFSEKQDREPNADPTVVPAEEVTIEEFAEIEESADSAIALAVDSRSDLVDFGTLDDEEEAVSSDTVENTDGNSSREELGAP